MAMLALADGVAYSPQSLHTFCGDFDSEGRALRIEDAIGAKIFTNAIGVKFANNSPEKSRTNRPVKRPDSAAAFWGKIQVTFDRNSEALNSVVSGMLFDRISVHFLPEFFSEKR